MDGLKQAKKPKSWALLNHKCSFMDGPWCCMGDFNAILHSSEKQSKYSPPYKQMDDYRNVLDDCRLEDLGFASYPFTWNNKRLGLENPWERLDRPKANTGWKKISSELGDSSILSHIGSLAFTATSQTRLTAPGQKHKEF